MSYQGKPSFLTPNFLGIIRVIAVIICVMAISAVIVIRLRCLSATEVPIGGLLPAFESGSILTSAGAPCHVIRYESKACPFCTKDRTAWEELRRDLQRRGCDAFVLSDGPNSQIEYPLRDNVHPITSFTVAQASALRLYRTPTTLVTNGQWRVTWAHVGGMSPGDRAEAALRVTLPIWIAMVRPIEVPEVTASRPKATIASVVKSVPVEDSPRLGNQSAPIQIVEFADFQCPCCAVAAVNLRAVFEARPAKVSVVFKQFPLGFIPTRVGLRRLLSRRQPPEAGSSATVI